MIDRTLGDIMRIRFRQLIISIFVIIFVSAIWALADVIFGPQGLDIVKGTKWSIDLIVFAWGSVVFTLLWGEED